MLDDDEIWVIGGVAVLAELKVEDVDSSSIAEVVVFTMLANFRKENIEGADGFCDEGCGVGDDGGVPGCIEAPRAKESIVTRGSPIVPPVNGGTAGFEGCDCCV